MTIVAPCAIRIPLRLHVWGVWRGRGCVRAAVPTGAHGPGGDLYHSTTPIADCNKANPAASRRYLSPYIGSHTPHTPHIHLRPRQTSAHVCSCDNLSQ